MWPQQPLPPYYPPYGADPLEQAKAYIKAMKKLEKKATEAEAAKHKPKTDKPKSRFEKMDIFHMGLGLFALFPIIGPVLGILYLDILIKFKETLNLLLK